jgi:hypothetical protein
VSVVAARRRGRDRKVLGHPASGGADGAAGTVGSIMRRVPVDSSSLASVGYDADTCVLELAFRQGGVYQYFDVPADVYQEFMAAESHGRYFTESIRPVYEFRRLE